MSRKTSLITPAQGGLQPTRRDFLQGASALGVSALAGSTLFPQSAKAASPEKGGKMVAGLAGGATTDTLDPATYTDTYMQAVSFATHSNLTEISPTGELIGDAAESWEASPDAKQWTFKLRKGITFSNGKDVAPEDVIASFNHHRGEESKSGVKNLVEPIEDIVVDGDNSVTFILKGGNADFPYLTVDYHFPIMPAVDGKADWQNYIGSGGYVLGEHEPGVRTTLKRRDDYWKEGRAHVEEVEIIGIAEANARQTALTTGDIDVMNRCDLKTVHLMARNSDISVNETTGFKHYTMPMNTTLAPFDNNDVRLALKYAIDREALVKTILKGHGAVANDHPISPSVPFHAGDMVQRTYDPDKAKFHLKQAGMDSLPLDLSAADAAFGGAVDAAVLYKEQAAKAGININVVREPNDGYWSNVWMVKPWCMCFWGGRPTADWMFSTAYAADSNWNDTFWKDEQFNKLLLEARAELDNVKRGEMYGEMQRLLSDEGGVVVWGFANDVFAMSNSIGHEEEMAGNWELDGTRFIERWWKTS
ncbi:MAG: ABC transporter substrate-binding protein [Pseudomonadota bacterium]